MTFSAQRDRTSDPDRTARSRIHDAALIRFAQDGIAATSIKAIAADVGVSPPLVIHHFGSKDGLRAACDEYVAAAIRENKRAAIAAGRKVDALDALRQSAQGPPLLKYLARTLVDGSPQVRDLIDEMVADAVEYMAEGVEAGMLTPSEYPRARAVVLLMWNLGAVVLHEHVDRLLDVDLTGNDPDRMLGWLVPAFEILAKGTTDVAIYEQFRASARPEDLPRE
jgi:AcrR family transcriptional regulator